MAILTSFTHVIGLLVSSFAVLFANLVSIYGFVLPLEMYIGLDREDV